MDSPTIYNLAPELERCCKELEKDIKRGEPVFIQRNNSSHFIDGMNEYKTRQLLKSRVKRIRIE